MPTKTIETWPERVQLEALAGHPSASVGVIIKTGYIAKQGDVVGKISAGGLYRRRARTVTVGDGFADDAETGEFEDASAFKAGDVLTTAAGLAIGTIESIAFGEDEDPDVITLTANAENDVLAGVGVIATDGSAVAMGIADAETDGTADTPIAVIIRGVLKESLLRGLDASAKSELAGASVAGGVFKF